MTLGEGQDQQAQNEVDIQVTQEMQRSGGRALRVEAKKRCCGVCGKTGHNARTCQVVISLSEEDDGE